LNRLFGRVDAHLADALPGYRRARRQAERATRARRKAGACIAATGCGGRARRRRPSLRPPGGPAREKNGRMLTSAQEASGTGGSADE
jgi:hypothetical protein